MIRRRLICARPLRVLLLILGCAAADGLAQEPPDPKRKPVTGGRTEAMGSIRVLSPIETILRIDNQPGIQLSANSMREIRLTLGGHVLRATDGAGEVRWEQSVTIRSGPPQLVEVKFGTSSRGGGVSFAPIKLPAGATLVEVPGGTFDLGCGGANLACRSSDPPYRKATLSRPFRILATPVTRQQYLAFANETGVKLAMEQQRQGSTQAFVNVRWSEASSYCSWMQGRLPTDAEWERAFRSSAADAPAATRTKGFRDFGIWEWTQDWYGPVSGAREVDPAGPTAGTNRVVRMGTWSGASLLATMKWDNLAPDRRYDDVGFRCVTLRLQ